MGGTKMTKSLREYVNDVMNDNRIFSYEDVLAMDNEEGKYYQKALDYQYGKIGFPNNAELAKSSDVVYVHEYTRQDGTVVRAHYRSKAGHGNPDKPVMQTPNEYKTTLEKEINDYMDRDVEKRYGAGVNKTDNVTEYLQGLIDILPETGYEETSETEYTPLYPSNGKLTGHVEISQDISNEMPVADIQPRIKLSAQAKPVSKPYTGREMNMSSVQLPEMERLGQLEDLHVHQAVHSWPSRKLTLSNEIMRRADRLKKEVDKSINQINESLNKIKLNSKSVVKNFITDKFLRGIDGPDNQRLIRYLPTLVVFNEYKNAFKYYRYALNNLQGADKDNLIFILVK